MLHENKINIQQIEHDEKKELSEHKQSLDYFDLNAQVFHLLLFKNMNFITDALIFEEISSYLTKTIPICNFQKVNLSNHEDASISEVMCAFLYPNNQWDLAQVLLLENLRFDHLEELDALSNIRYIGFMNRSEFERAWANPTHYRKLIFLEFASGLCKSYTFPELKSEQELTDHYIQYGSFATADKIIEMKERAKMLNEVFMEKGKTAVAELTSMIENFQLEEHSLTSLLEFTVSFYDLKPGCFDFINICQKNAKANTAKGMMNPRENDRQSEKSNTIQSGKTDKVQECTKEITKEGIGIKMNFQDILNDVQTAKNQKLIFEGFTAIWNEELGPIVIDHYPSDSNIDKETLAIQFFMTFETVFGQSPMKKTDLILPLAAFNKTAIIHLDLLENESVRGGKQPFIIAILAPESFSLIEINNIKPSIERVLQIFKSEHTSNVEALIEGLSNDIERNMNQSPSTKIITNEPLPPLDTTNLDIEPNLVKSVDPIAKAESISHHSEIQPELNGVVIDISQSPKILPKIEKEVKTLNQMNKLPNEKNQNPTNTNISQSIESVKHIQRPELVESEKVISGHPQLESVEPINESEPIESDKLISETMNSESEKKKRDSQSIKIKKERKSKKILEKNPLTKKNPSNDIENAQTANINAETILKIKELIELPIPDFSDIKKMEAWFEAKNQMLRFFFESGMAE